MSASSGDAHSFAIHNARLRVIFPILDSTGSPVTGAASLDTELSQDTGTFADATNEATEIATSSGVYYLDLVAGELDTKSTAAIVKTATAGAKTTILTIYPKRLPVIRTGTAQAGAGSTITLDSGASAVDDFYNGCYVNCTNNSPSNVQGQARRITDYVGSTKVATVEAAWGTNPSSATTFEILAPGDTVNVAQWAGTQLADPATVGYPVSTNKVGTGTGEINLSSGKAPATIAAGDIANSAITAASIATGAIDADAIADNAIDAGAIASDAITNAKIADGAISAGKLASDTITAAKIAADAITDAKVASDVTIASVTGAVGSVTGAVGSVTGAVGSIASGGITTASFAAGAINAAAIGADAITDAKVASDVTIASVTGAVGSVTGNVGGNVTGSVGSVASGGITAASFAANAITAAKLDPDVTTELQAGLATASALATVAGYLDTEMAATLAAVLNLIAAGYTRTGTAQAGAAGSITLDSGASSVDDFYNNQIVVIASGAGAGQGRFISDYVGSTRVASVATWVTNPDNTSVFYTLPFGAIPGATAPTAAEVRQEIDNNSTRLAAIDAKTTNLPSDPADQSLVIAATTAIYDRIGAPTGASVSADVADIEGKVDDLEGRLTSTRAGYLDNLSAGAVAQASSLSSLDTKIGTPSNLGGGASVAANLADIEAQTDDIGTAGAGLTALGDTRIANLDATVSSRLASAGYTAPPSAATNASAMRTELTTELGRIDATVSSRATPAQVNTEADTALADVGLTTTITGRIDAAVSTRATPAEVNAEVVDALNVDTYAEPTGAPPATATLTRKIGQVYKHLRNEVTQTATTQTVKNDGGTVDITATVSDDATTFTRGKFS
jgi:hypothetical protein